MKTLEEKQKIQKEIEKLNILKSYCEEMISSPNDIKNKRRKKNYLGN